MKLLPHYEGEDLDNAMPKVLRVVSRRFATKVMHTGVVARPNEAHSFDGKIDLIRVATEKSYKKNMHLDDAFSDEVDVNDAVQTN